MTGTTLRRWRRSGTSPGRMPGVCSRLGRTRRCAESDPKRLGLNAKERTGVKVKARETRGASGTGSAVSDPGVRVTVHLPMTWRWWRAPSRGARLRSPRWRARWRRAEPGPGGTTLLNWRGRTPTGDGRGCSAGRWTPRTRTWPRRGARSTTSPSSRPTLMTSTGTKTRTMRMRMTQSPTAAR